jgi:hypothetical protein
MTGCHNLRLRVSPLCSGRAHGWLCMHVYTDMSVLTRVTHESPAKIHHCSSHNALAFGSFSNVRSHHLISPQLVILEVSLRATCWQQTISVQPCLLCGSVLAGSYCSAHKWKAMFFPLELPLDCSQVVIGRGFERSPALEQTWRWFEQRLLCRVSSPFTRQNA